MKAPERIWIDNYRDTDEGHIGVWGERPHINGSIEYIRADVVLRMVDKAVDNALERAALEADGLDWACNSKRNRVFVEADLMMQVALRDASIANAIRALKGKANE